jgi:hypothetical protein
MKHSTIRLPDALYERAEAGAKKNDVSVSEFIRQAIDKEAPAGAEKPCRRCDGSGTEPKPKRKKRTG